MNQNIIAIGFFASVLLLALLMSMTIGIDCTGNPNMSPFKAISMAQQGLCR